MSVDSAVRSSTRKNSIQSRCYRERGAVLAVSLILLLLVTVLGVSTIGTTTLQEKMAANTRDKDLAFQAAELAMKVAERLVEQGLAASDFTAECSSGLCSMHDPSTHLSRWKDPNICGSGADIWSCNKSQAVDGADAVSSASHSQQPRYFIELVAHLDTGDHLNIGNIGDAVHSEEATVYRITAIGYGGSSTSQSVLQSTYAK